MNKIIIDCLSTFLNLLNSLGLIYIAKRLVEEFYNEQDNN